MKTAAPALPKMPKVKMPSVANPGIPTAKPAAANRVAMPKPSKPSSVPKPLNVTGVHIEKADNGGFISKASVSSRKPGTLGGPWEERQELKGAHKSLSAVKGHLDKLFPQQTAKSSAPQPAWAGVANKMLGK
jgi:hypothetical protein